MLEISSFFEAGNIEVISAEKPDDIRLRIRPDVGPDGFFQWFYYRVVTESGTPLCMHIENAGQSSYSQGWEGYQACASYDRETWFRIDTTYKDGVLTLSYTPEVGSLYFAYFAPYSLERHQSLVALAQTDTRVTASILGKTVDGDVLDLLTIGESATTRRALWFIGRQHPGETMAQFWMEGLIERLLDRDDPVARAVLEKSVLYIVPNINPDGSRRGHLRANAAGVNLNRAWAEPARESSPEVYYTRAKMDETGVDLLLDVHGDETIPYNFIASADAIPNVESRQITLRKEFEAVYERVNPDFQRVHGYPEKAPGQANLKFAAAQSAYRFGCLAMTLEMPFKDNANAPDPIQGWSQNRCKKLGASALDPVLAVLDDLR